MSRSDYWDIEERLRVPRQGRARHEGSSRAWRTEEEKKKVEAHYTSDVKLLGSVPLDTGVYALCYRPDGAVVAVGGEDGKVRFVNAADAKVAKEFVPVPLNSAQLAELPAH